MAHTPLQIEQHQWKRENPGVIKRIAETLGVSRTWVSFVLNGHRSSFNSTVEDALREAGAPMPAKKKEAKKEK